MPELKLNKLNVKQEYLDELTQFLIIIVQKQKFGLMAVV